MFNALHENLLASQLGYKEESEPPITQLKLERIDYKNWMFYLLLPFFLLLVNSYLFALLSILFVFILKNLLKVEEELVLTKNKIYSYTHPLTNNRKFNIFFLTTIYLSLIIFLNVVINQNLSIQVDKFIKAAFFFQLDISWITGIQNIQNVTVSIVEVQILVFLAIALQIAYTGDSLKVYNNSSLRRVLLKNKTLISLRFYILVAIIFSVFTLSDYFYPQFLFNGLKLLILTITILIYRLTFSPTSNNLTYTFGTGRENLLSFDLSAVGIRNQFRFFSTVFGLTLDKHSDEVVPVKPFSKESTIYFPLSIEEEFYKINKSTIVFNLVLSILYFLTLNIFFAIKFGLRSTQFIYAVIISSLAIILINLILYKLINRYLDNKVSETGLGYFILSEEVYGFFETGYYQFIHKEYVRSIKIGISPKTTVLRDALGFLRLKNINLLIYLFSLFIILVFIQWYNAGFLNIGGLTQFFSISVQNSLGTIVTSSQTFIISTTLVFLLFFVVGFQQILSKATSFEALKNNEISLKHNILVLPQRLDWLYSYLLRFHLKNTNLQSHGFFRLCFESETIDMTGAEIPIKELTYSLNTKNPELKTVKIKTSKQTDPIVLTGSRLFNFHVHRFLPADQGLQEILLTFNFKFSNGEVEVVTTEYIPSSPLTLIRFVSNLSIVFDLYIANKPFS